MSRVCEICGKKPGRGNIVVRRGKPKREGGIGQHITGITHRRWLPNIQRVKILVNGAPKRVKVCTSCIRHGRVTKAV